MKKRLFAVFLAALLLGGCAIPAFAAESLPNGFGSYEHVIIVGFDGLGAMWETVDSPNFDRIFKQNGAYRYNAKAEFITISAQNWGAILTGTDADTHGMGNGSISQYERSADTACKSVFNYARQAFPDARLVSYNNWWPINYGIIEKDIGVEKYDDRNSPYEEQDPRIAQWVVEDLKTKELPKLMYVHFNDPDHFAHTYGADSDGYKQSCKTADTQMGAIYDAAVESGFMEHGLFIVTADHGEIGFGHGGQSVPESSVVFGVAGPGVNKGVLPASVRNRDVAAVTLYALGIEKPAQMSACLPQGLFPATTNDAHSHTYDSGVVREVPTCTQPGQKLISCLYWDESRVEPIDPFGHKDENADGKCDLCGETLDSGNTNTDNGGNNGGNSGGGSSFSFQTVWNAIRDFWVRLFQRIRSWFQ